MSLCYKDLPAQRAFIGDTFEHICCKLIHCRLALIASNIHFHRIFVCFRPITVQPSALSSPVNGLHSTSYNRIQKCWFPTPLIPRTTLLPQSRYSELLDSCERHFENICFLLLILAVPSNSLCHTWHTTANNILKFNKWSVNFNYDNSVFLFYLAYLPCKLLWGSFLHVCALWKYHNST